MAWFRGKVQDAELAEEDRPRAPTMALSTLGFLARMHPERRPATLALLAGELDRPGSVDRRAEAVAALGRMEDDAATQLLLDRIGPADPVPVRVALAGALRGAPRYPPLDLAARSCQLQLLRDPAWLIRHEAAANADAFAPLDDALREALVVALDDEVAEVRDRALMALASAGDPRVRGILLARLGDPAAVRRADLRAADFTADRALLDALERLDDPATVRVIEAANAPPPPGSDDPEIAYRPGVAELLSYAILRCRGTAQDGRDRPRWHYTPKPWVNGAEVQAPPR